MAITDATAIRFSNEFVRVSADGLAHAYYLCDAARDRWDSLGGGQGAIDAMTSDIRQAANKLVWAYEFCWRAEKVWFLLGGTSMIPNTSETVSDGSPADGRPAATGQKCVAVIDRVVQLQNWLLSPDGVFTNSARSGSAYYNTVLAASSYGPVTLSVSDAGNFMNRCGELRTNYEASSNTNLGTLLALAVNPQG